MAILLGSHFSSLLGASEQSFTYHLLTENQLEQNNSALKIFEEEAKQKYSLGTDFFTIDHGVDYFSFFKRLGEVNYFLIKKDNEIVGTGCTILRTLNGRNFWYLCDLKVKPEYRGHGLTIKLFRHFFLKLFWKCRSGYLISMDPGSKQIVRIFRGLDKFSFLGVKIEPKLLIYSVGKKEIINIFELLENYFGQITFLSLKGKKDLILDSDGNRINLYHLQHGIFADRENSIGLDDLPDDLLSRSTGLTGEREKHEVLSRSTGLTGEREKHEVLSRSTGTTIMFCLLETNDLVNKLKLDYRIETDITATIISGRMNSFDWNQILTSDI